MQLLASLYIGRTEDAQLYSFFNLGATWAWVVNATSRPLYPRERDPVPTVQEAGWAPGPVWTGAENLAFIGIRSPDLPTRSQSLYLQSYPGPPGSFYCTFLPFLFVSAAPPSRLDAEYDDCR